MNVLEISSGTAAAYAGLLLAELGFHVDRVNVEPRHPHADPEDAQAAALFFDRGKQSVEAADLRLERYDAVIEDVGPRRLRRLKATYRRARAANPRVAYVSLSEFGRSGPYADWHATDINAQAAGGVIHGSGYAGEAPRKLPGDAAAMIAGIHGATAAVSTAFGTASGAEESVHVDISAQDTFMQHWTRHVADYAYSGTRLGRQHREPRGFHYRHTARAKDGWLFLLALRQPWQDLAAFLGLGGFITPERMDPEADQPPWDEVEDAFEQAVAQKARYEWFEQAADLGWTFAPVEDPWAVAHGPQTEARRSMLDLPVDGRTVKVPGLPFRFDERGDPLDAMGGNP